jgi:hypothetical protein
MSTGNIAENNLDTWNRALELLAAGDYETGLELFEVRWQLFPRLMSARSQQWAQWLPYWRGEDISGKKLLVIHEQGFGDSIMLLRFVPQLCARGAKVWLDVPRELEWLAAQIAPIARDVKGDYVVAFYDVMRYLQTTPATIPRAPYLAVGNLLANTCKHQLGRRHIGIAWSTLCKYPGEQARSMALHDFLELAGLEARQCISLQAHAHEEAAGAGVRPVHYQDFMGVATVASLMDRIVSIDTAALHVAGAIGHPDVTGILPPVPNWRWSAPWYPQMKFIRRQSHADEAA